MEIEQWKHRGRRGVKKHEKQGYSNGEKQTNVQPVSLINFEWLNLLICPWHLLAAQLAITDLQNIYTFTHSVEQQLLQSCLHIELFVGFVLLRFFFFHSRNASVILCTSVFIARLINTPRVNIVRISRFPLLSLTLSFMQLFIYLLSEVKGRKSANDVMALLANTHLTATVCVACDIPVCSAFLSVTDLMAVQCISVCKT